MKQIFSLLLALAISLTVCQGSDRWPEHDISTLKLLQIVHRHGDRAPIRFVPNDPFQNESFWPEGMGELTTKGKYRLYKRGQFIRQEYNSYLGDKFSPREVYTRSSITDRCIESVSCLLSGAYPPKQKFWQWNNGSDAQLGNLWQPFPIQTFMPKSEDLICNIDKHCPAVSHETAKIFQRPNIKKFVADNSELYSNLSKITGNKISDIGSAAALWDSLFIEMQHNYYWRDIWTKEEQMKIFDQLVEAHEMQFRYNWDSPIIKRLRSGGLVQELIKNMRSVLENENNKKLFIYSTHDTTLAALMHALNIWNGRGPPFGATLLIELHEKKNGSVKNTNDYFVRVFYNNDTVINSENPHSLQLTDCQNRVDCPLNQFFNSTKHLLYDNINDECNKKY